MKAAQSLLPLDDGSAGAEFSVDRVYRYKLWRTWGHGRLVCFLMLNPSTADETDLDPTLRRCRGFAKAWEFSGFVVVNLFAVVSPDPRVLLTQQDAAGDLPRETTLGRVVTNLMVIQDEVQLAGRVVVGWGAFPEARERAERVTRLIRSYGVEPHCLGTTRGGHPKHPLYLASNTALVPFASNSTEV